MDDVANMSDGWTYDNLRQCDIRLATPPLEEMLALFEEHHRGLDQRVRKMDDAAWDRKGKLSFGGKLMMEPQVGEFLWYLLFDAIHHRGQLAAYLRPIGGKVPAIYGPSADSRG